MLLSPTCVVCSEGAGPVCRICAAALQPGARSIVEGLHLCRSRTVLDDRSRRVIAAFKYRRQRCLAGWLAEQMSDLVPSAADAITWVPATPERKRDRGYDQSQALAKALGRLTGVPVARLLKRSGTDRRQTGLNRTERLAGPVLRSTRSSGAELVVVVDDVVTTGASLRAAAEQMAGVGTRRVVGVVFAATPTPGDFSLHSLPNRSSIDKWM